MIKNLIILTGEDDFRLRERVKLYKTLFRKKYPDGEIESFDQEHTFRDLENSVCTPNLFGGKRLIFTEGFWNTDNFEKSEKTKFFEKLPSFEDTCSLIVVEPKMDKRLKSSKFFLGAGKKPAAGKVETFDALDDNQLIQWILKYTPSQDGSIDRSTAQFLVRRCGHNLWNLSQEIQKLVLMKDGTISQTLIEQYTIPHPDAVIWDFLEQLSKQNLSAALKQFHTLLESKVTVHEILPMIFREVRIHAQLLNGIQQNLTPKEIASTTKLHPFVVQKTLPLTRKFPSERIEKMYDMLFEIDRNMKTGKLSVKTDDTTELELAIEKFILTVCE